MKTCLIAKPSIRQLAWLLISSALCMSACADEATQEAEEVVLITPWDLDEWMFTEPGPAPDMTPDMSAPIDMAADMSPAPVDMRAPVEQVIGDACASGRVGCGEAASCNDSWPDGYCTASCGDDPNVDICPSLGGVCVFDTPGTLLCAKACEEDAECRENYSCQPAVDGTTVCKPTPIQPPTGTEDGGACGSDQDCAGGTCIPEADGWPGGYCTTLDCRNLNDCASPGGEDNRCYQNQQGPNLCVRICQQSDECRMGYVCEPVGGGQGFCVPDPSEPITEDFSAYPFSITCTAQQGSVYDFEYDVDMDTTAYMVTSIARDGRDVFADRALLPAGGNINYRGQNSFQLTSSQLFGWLSPLITPAVPQFASQLEVGSHTLSIETNSADICTYYLQESTPGTSIDLNIYFVGVPGISASNAAASPSIQKVLTQFDSIYAQANITRANVRYYDITGADAQSYQIIRSESDMTELVSRSTLPGPTYSDALSMNIFFVRSFAMQGGAIGTSLGLPGPAGIHGTRASGVVFTSEFLGQNFQDADGSFTDGDNYTGVVLAHEVGHYLGLFHTTESFGGGSDPLNDTPECRRRDFPDNCDDLNNLMFPYAGISHTEVSADQAFVLKANPLTKD